MLAKRRAGGARSRGRYNTIDYRLVAMMRSPAGPPKACHEIASGPPGACLKVSGALETVRRPRGASRASSAPTSVSGQLCLWDYLDRLVFRLETVSRPPGAWLKVSGALETVRRPRGAALTQSPGGQSRRTRQWHRHNWPETDVGPGLPGKRRAGGARSQGRYNTIDYRLVAMMRSPAGPPKACHEIASGPPGAWLGFLQRPPQANHPLGI